MTDLLREQVSTLADGELAEAEADLLLKRMQSDPALRGAWESYHLAGEAMRKGLAPGGHDKQFSARVMQAINAEEFVPARTFGDSLANLLKPVAGLAIAASVATIAIMSMQTRPVTPPSEVVPSNVTANATNVDYRLAQPVNWNLTEQDEVKEKLNSYLVNHNMNSKSRTFQGMNPYVHIAAYDNRVAEQNEEENTETPVEAGTE